MEQLKRIRNGAKVAPTFSDAEMNRRLEALRAHMAERQVDVCLFTSHHNIAYFSDFLYCAFGRNYGLVVGQEGQTTISANIDGGQPWRRTFGDNVAYTDWHRDNFFAAVKSLIPDGSRVGIEFDHVTVENLRKLQGALPSAELVDVGKAAMRMRMVKSAEEIAWIRESARIADIGGAACVEAIAVGVPEYEVALHATGAMVREIGNSQPHVELMDTWTWFQSGINTDGAHNPVTSRRIERGDILSLNCFPMPAGYYTALERTLFAEECSDEHLRLWKINVEVHEAGIGLIRPGARCCDIAAELNRIYARHGLLENRTFGYGHSFGVLCHYYGREAGLELREDVTTVLQPDMVVSMEPMIMIPEGRPGAGGYREHDILVVTEDGAEDITRFPYGPEHNIVRK
ncbi:MAG: aminopeptidase P family protein [Defluviicoccus sp.]|nr:aminopeptidase P family protein [Defluviicoccus sp.]MDE0385611.1 aminopeptidase P family protein [Defluviicoccus sp.]